MDSSSFPVKTLLTATAGAVLGAGVAYYCLNNQRGPDATSNSANSVPSSSSAPSAATKPAGPKVTVSEHLLEDDILREHFTRNMQFFGEEAQVKISKSFVVVVGLGGVGSHAAHMLLRSGVGRLRIVDFDQVRCRCGSIDRNPCDPGLPRVSSLHTHTLHTTHINRSRSLP